LERMGRTPVSCTYVPHNTRATDLLQDAIANERIQ
jgi:hypothetical protein